MLTHCFDSKYICVCVCVAVKLLCGLEASQGPVQEVLSSADGVSQADPESSDEQEADGDSKGSRKKKNKRRKGTGSISMATVTIEVQRRWNGAMTAITTGMQKYKKHSRWRPLAQQKSECDTDSLQGV